MKGVFPIILLATFIQTTSFAQGEPAPVKEVGLVFSGLNSFGMTYRSGTEKALWRFGSAFGDLDFSWDKPKSGSTVSSSISSLLILRVGREKRSPITEKLDLRFGADLGLTGGYIQSKVTGGTKNTQWYGGPGVNLVVGVNYKLGGRFLIGAELLPGVSYQYKRLISEYPQTPFEHTVNTSSINFGFSNFGSTLSLVYQL